MFDNVGEKLMGFAKVFFWLSVIGYIIIGFYLNFEYDIGALGFLLVLIAIPLSALPISWAMYGFGQMVQDIHDGRRTSLAPAPNKPEVVSDELPEL